MTSSFRIKKKYENGGTWQFGPWYDHYVRPYGECHPDYDAIPIGRPEGVKICVRRDVSTLQQYPPRRPPSEGAPDDVLYNPQLYEGKRARNAIQQFNPWRYDQRRSPNESYNRENDTWRREVVYDGTGFMKMFSYTPQEKYNAGLANSPSSTTSLYPRSEVYGSHPTYGSHTGPFITYRAEVGAWDTISAEGGGSASEEPRSMRPARR